MIMLTIYNFLNQKNRFVNDNYSKGKLIPVTGRVFNIFWANLEGKPRLSKDMPSKI